MNAALLLLPVLLRQDGLPALLLLLPQRIVYGLQLLLPIGHSIEIEERVPVTRSDHT